MSKKIQQDFLSINRALRLHQYKFSLQITFKAHILKFNPTLACSSQSFVQKSFHQPDHLFKLPTPPGCLTQVELPFHVLMGQEALKTLLLRDILKRFRCSNEDFAIIGTDLSDLPFHAIKRLRILQK